MKVKTLYAGILTGLIAIGSPAFATDLVQAYRDALGHDAQLASVRAQLSATRSRVPLARAGLLPNVNGSVSVNRQLVDTNIGPSQDFNSQSYVVAASLPLYRPQNWESFEQSKLAEKISEAQYAQAEQDLMLRVAQAYFDVLGAQDNLTTIRAQKRAISEQLAAAKRNFEVGTATVTDQQEAQSRFDLTVAQELAIENDLDVKRATLALLVGKPIGTLYTLRSGVKLEGPQPAAETDWTENARQNSFYVQQALIGSELANREIARQRLANRPTLDLVAQLAHVVNPSASAMGINSNSGLIGVQLAMPLYTGGAIQARIGEAVANHEKALSDLEVARRSAEQAARQTFYGVRSGLAQVTALEAAERSSQLSLDSNLLGYQVGVRINIDVLNAQQQLFSTRRDLAKARYDVLVNGLRLESTAGTLSEEDLAKVASLLVAAPN
jgi:outer membrane protein